MDVEERKVSWGTVIAGIVVAGLIGFVITIFSTLGGMFVYDEIHNKAVGVLVTVAVPVGLLALVYFTTRRKAPDFARGLIIGTCLVLIWSSTCGFTMVGARIAG
jgi:hypothetical protein